MGMHKFWSPGILPPEAFGMQPESTGMPMGEFKSKLISAVNFIQDTAKKMFGPSIANPEFIKKYKQVLSFCNAYSNELNWWMARNPDYIAWSHGNINMDNCYFWRDEKNELDCGLLDWGSVTASPMGGKFWWWLYCCEYDHLTSEIDVLVQMFIDQYHMNGGPLLEHAELKLHFLISAMKQGLGLLGAVPQIYMMCPRKQWETITGRFDERITKNIHGKSNLRVYIGTFIN